MPASLVARSLAIAALTGLALTACSGSSTSTDSNPRQGNPDTYQRINALTDCVALQAEFDRFDRAHSEFIEKSDLANAETATDYMKAVDDRMRTIGCYS